MRTLILLSLVGLLSFASPAAFAAESATVAGGQTVFSLPARPAATLAEDVAAARVRLGGDYLAAHPRVVASADEFPALKAKMAAQGELWEKVIVQARGMGGYVPTGEQVRTGWKYWRAEWILSGALAYALTGEQAWLDNTLSWMKAFCAEPVWGVKYNSNHDLEASWYLYYISLAYDLVYDAIPAAERETIAASLAAHAEAIYEAKSAYTTFTYDQNHMYIPTTALATAALALADDYGAESTKWLTFAASVMNRCRWVLGADGYYYEGTGYWAYALHWHVRYADMIQRAAGGKVNMFDLPALRLTHLYARYMYLPGTPFAYDLGDTGAGPLQRATKRTGAWSSMLYRIGRATGEPDNAVMAEKLLVNGGDDPAMTFLWHWTPSQPVRYDQAATFHLFEDFDVLSWRSGWDDEALCVLFKAGPPQGHAATAKLKRLSDWKMNSGHVHPDLGMLWIYGLGEPLSMDSGYLAEKFTDDHSTLLVDGHGMGNDGSYWAYRDRPYAEFNRVRFLASDVNASYAYAVADLTAAWANAETPKLKMVRHALITREFILVIDELADVKPHVYSFLLNTETTQYTREHDPSGWGSFIQADGQNACLRVYPIAGGDEISYGPNEVRFGRGPGKYELRATGGQIRIESKSTPQHRFVTLIVPARPMDIPPQTRLLRNDTEAVELKFDFGTVGVNLAEKRAYFDPPRQ